MNELKILYDNYSYLYYKTNKESAKEALDEYEWLCDRIGIDLSNMNMTECVLRDEDGDDISYII